MNNVCEVILSTCGKDKINISGYLIVKDKRYKDVASDYNYAAQASRVEVVKTITRIKEHAQLTSKMPTQVLQTDSLSQPSYGAVILRISSYA
ncbi:7856_t:CDS:2 [Gigaspora rosea]|nr:7856_t:CDS:2 [Gigaspora rosea]